MKRKQGTIIFLKLVVFLIGITACFVSILVALDSQ